jgi:hypothetical protein
MLVGGFVRYRYRLVGWLSTSNSSGTVHARGPRRVPPTGVTR